MPQEHTTPVGDLIRTQLDSLTAAERKVGRALLADYPAAGLGSAQYLARLAGVSAPTVVRLATHLGFDGYVAMQAQLRAEVSQRASSPVLRTLAHGDGQRPRTRFHEAMQLRRQAIDSTRMLIPHSEFDRACRLLSECTKQVVVTGGFFSSYIAQIFALQLSQVRSSVVFAEEPLRRDVAVMLDIRNGSVVVIFDLRRYEHNAVTLAQHARRAGAAVILVTDRWLSPVAEAADVVLPVEVEATPFDSFVGLLAAVEVIVESVMQKSSPSALGRMQRWEDAAVAHTSGVDPA